MIKQFDEQESEDESEEEKGVKPTTTGPQQPGTMKAVPLASSEDDESEQDDESEEEDDESE